MSLTAAAAASPEAFQAAILPHVSRTFALTIPQLPANLAAVVANAYLLCRITDTIEDDPELQAGVKLAFHQQFTEVVAGKASAADFAAQLAPQLAPAVPAPEKILIQQTEKVMAVFASFRPAQQRVLHNCVQAMSHGMPWFERHASPAGLPDLRALDRYCYYVAGVVGEMLTHLFCDHHPSLQAQHSRLTWLAVSFGQGLQMTNILKDIWDDAARGICWLPQEMFPGLDLSQLQHCHTHPTFAQGMHHLVGLAHTHLQHALQYTQALPATDPGMRRFCLWAVGIAVKTLNNIACQPHFSQPTAVKVPRRVVRRVIFQTSCLARWNKLLSYWFNQISRGIPTVPLAQDWAPEKLMLPP